MAKRLVGIPDWQFFTSTGGVAAGYKIYFYVPGTTTNKDIYSDTSGTTQTNPVTLNSAGKPSSDVYTEGLYDVVVKDADSVSVNTIPNWGDDWSAVGTDLSENLLSNHSGETAGSGSEAFANWTETDAGSVISRDTSDPYHGTACFLFTSASNGSQYLTSDYMECSPGQDIVVGTYIKGSNANAEPKMQILWATSAQAAISTATIYNDDNDITPTSWTRKDGFSATPPATARYFQLRLIGNAASTSYTTRFDGITVFAIDRISVDAPYGRPYGLQISIDSGDTSHDLKITAGAVKDSDGVIYHLPYDVVKKIDAGWDESSNNSSTGGRASGTSIPSDGMLYLFIIKDTDTGHTDVLIDEDAYSPTLPTGYDASKYLGAARTDSSQNLASAVWFDNECILTTSTLTTDISDSSLTNATYETGTINGPPEAWVHARVAVTASGSDLQGESFFMWRPTASSASTYMQVGADIDDLAGGEIDHINDAIRVYTDSSSQIDYAARFNQTSSDPTLSVNTIGWKDLRRDQP